MSGVHKHPTISFRVSDREREMIEAKILASGMQKKDYFVRSCIYKGMFGTIVQGYLKKGDNWATAEMMAREFFRYES